ncbi:IS4 family transposase [Flavivirga amylovorans]|uniref:IS4 family transposase n=2 Tax=Flavivirga amylovorans TaxID=870486 RepID=A0ABT8X7Y2_9FLAO|nr:IS4 family transposase [Flavivirga amylovorans]MDO5989798.1 IS4 family transposase [Flavivirga amylovorans]
MSVFKDHKISVNELLQIIPESLLSQLSINTKVDYYAKVLHGKKMFYLLLYGILENEKLSQRSLEDTFNDPIFKTLFNLDNSETVRRSSISERLSKIDVGYFKEIFDCIYEQFSNQYSTIEQTKYNLIRVDSTIVSELAGKLKAGINQNNGKKFIKYSMLFDGLLPSGIEVFDSQTYTSEENALPKTILNHVKKQKDHTNIYVIDRGLQSSRTMKKFDDQKISFIVRARENRKYQQVQSLIEEHQQKDLGELVLIKDAIVKFYTGVPIKNSKGNTHYREEKVENPLRLVIAKSKSSPEKEFWIITNAMDLSAKEITDYYRKRWDIEVFFRFIKQELNVKHFLSLNKNGIQVMIYMSLITAMLILLYKKTNNLGYKTAKRRLKMEIRNLAIAIIITHTGGDPNMIFKKET